MCGPNSPPFPAQKAYGWTFVFVLNFVLWIAPSYGWSITVASNLLFFIYIFFTSNSLGVFNKYVYK